MHFPSERMVGYLALAEAGLWAFRVNDDRDLVLVVKTTTDTLKWMSRGVPINFLMGHVQQGDQLIRVIGIEVFNSGDGPFIFNQPQVEPWEVEALDKLLRCDSFMMYCHNEQPFMSVLDCAVTLPRDAVETYVRARTCSELFTAPVLAPVFREALYTFEKYLRGKPPVPGTSVELFRWSLEITSHRWNTITVPEGGTFEPDSRDEGTSHEQLVFQTLQPHLDGMVLLSPRIQDGKAVRQFCDVLALARSIFVFEAKTFSVFEKDADQTSERRASTVMKDFRKALRQLKGAVRRLGRGMELLNSEERRLGDIAQSQFEAVHGVIVVSTMAFDLPWREIGKQLAESQQSPNIHYHFVPLMDLQRMVAFTRGSSVELDLMLRRLAEIIASSGNAHVVQDFRPALPTTMRTSPASPSSLGLRFVWIGADAAEWLKALFEPFYEQMLRRGFSGRVDFYGDVGQYKGRPCLGVGVAPHSPAQPITSEWLEALRDDLFRMLSERNIPLPQPQSVRCEAVAKITSYFSDLLFSVEFQSGYAVAKREGDPNAS